MGRGGGGGGKGRGVGWGRGADRIQNRVSRFGLAVRRCWTGKQKDLGSILL